MSKYNFSNNTCVSFTASSLVACMYTCVRKVLTTPVFLIIIIIVVVVNNNETTTNRSSSFSATPRHCTFYFLHSVPFFTLYFSWKICNIVAIYSHIYHLLTFRLMFQMHINMYTQLYIIIVNESEKKQLILKQYLPRRNNRAVNNDLHYCVEN